MNLKRRFDRLVMEIITDWLDDRRPEWTPAEGADLLGINSETFKSYLKKGGATSLVLSHAVAKIAHGNPVEFFGRHESFAPRGRPVGVQLVSDADAEIVRRAAEIFSMPVRVRMLELAVEIAEIGGETFDHFLLALEQITRSLTAAYKESPPRRRK